jgi:hypothetical protein
MLMRFCYSKSESIKPPFDEVQNRTTRDLQYLYWAEYMVAWRKDRLEIYEDHVRFPEFVVPCTDRSCKEFTRQGVDNRS